MPQTVSVKIGDRTVMVRELLMKEIREIYTAPDRPVADAVAHLLSLCSDVQPDELLEYAPSEIAPLITAMLEVNKAFFDQAAMLKFEEVAADLKTLILKISTLAYFTSSPPATA